jgi:hypothetical protein
MAEPIIPIAQIEREAAEAAKRFDDINDACPYPFDSDAGRAFKVAFTAARQTSATTTKDHP